MTPSQELREHALAGSVSGVCMDTWWKLSDFLRPADWISSLSAEERCMFALLVAEALENP